MEMSIVYPIYFLVFTLCNGSPNKNGAPFLFIFLTIFITSSHHHTMDQLSSPSADNWMMRERVFDLVLLSRRNASAAQRVEKLGVKDSPSRLMIEGIANSLSVLCSSATSRHSRSALCCRMDGAVRACVQYFNDRLAVIATQKSEAARFLLCVLWFEDCSFAMDSLRRLLCKAEEALSSGSESLLLAGRELFLVPAYSHFLRQLRHSVGVALPSLVQRCDRIAALTINRAVSAALDKYFQSAPDEFLPLSRSFSLWPLNVCCTANNTASAGESERDRDAALHRLVRAHSVDLLLSCFAHFAISLNRRHASLTSLCLNAALDSLLDAVLQRGLRVDEAGLYALFRQVLRLQEAVQELKRSLNIGVGERLISDVNPWRRAECALNVINTEIFRGEFSTRGKGRDRVAQGAIGSSMSVGLGQSALSETEELQFRATACRSSDKPLHSRVLEGLRWRKKHKGTIFVALSIDVSTL